MPENETMPRGAGTTDEPIGSRPVLPQEYGMPSTNDGILPWSHVVEQLESAKNYWVATADKNGKPHAVPVWAVWLDSALYFDGHPQTKWGRNLNGNPQISVHLESGDNVVILEGRITDVPSMDHQQAERIAEAFDAKYEYKPSAEDFASRGLYLLRPSVALAWDAFPATMTRWSFDHGA